MLDAMSVVFLSTEEEDPVIGNSDFAGCFQGSLKKCFRCDQCLGFAVLQLICEFVSRVAWVCGCDDAASEEGSIDDWGNIDVVWCVKG